MKKHAHSLILLPGLLLILLGAGFVAPIRQTGDYAAIDAFVMEQMAAHRLPGVALAIVQGDEIVHVRGFGRDGSGAEVTPQTPFRLGSIAKAFTAVAVIQLVEDGRLDLDSPVQAYLPWFTVADQELAADIRLRHLLHHTSGLSDLTYDRPAIPRRSEPLSDAVGGLERAGLAAPPGAAYSYFNLNYGLLGLVIERASGQSFAEYMAESVFEPLEMDDTYVEAAGQASLPGHLVVLGFPVAVDEPNLDQGAPSGGITSTAADMAHFLIALGNQGRYADRQLLSPGGVALLFSPPDVPESSSGMGWGVGEWDGVEIHRSSGLLKTYSADAVLLPSTGSGFALLINEANLFFELFAHPTLRDGVVALLLGDTPQGGIALSTIYWIVLVVIVLSLVSELRRLRALRRWPERARSLSRPKLAFDIGGDFFSAVLPVLVIWLVTNLLSQRVDLAMLFSYLPALTALLVLSAVIGLGKGLYKLWVLTRLRPAA